MLRSLLLGRRSFQGGVDLPMEAGGGSDSIHDLPDPLRLMVPLVQHDGRPMRPLVDVGRTLEAGTPIARAESGEAPDVHAPLAGQVTAMTRVDTATTCDVPAIAIEVRDTPTRPLSLTAAPPGGHPARLPACSQDPLAFAAGHQPQAAELADCADRAGVLDLSRPATGLGAKLREAAGLPPRHLVINALQPEPMMTAGARVLRDTLEYVLAAGLIIRNALGIKRAWLTVDAADRALLRHCRQTALGTPIRILPLANKYPQAAPSLLAWTITGREPPHGRTPLHTGTLVIDAVTLADFWPAWRHGAPALSRVIAVGGPAALRPGHYRVPVGTVYADLIDRIGLRGPLIRVIDGGPLTGRCVESLDAVVTRTTAALLLIDRDSDRIPIPGPCIRCGQCQQDCPVGLDPQQLLDALERGRTADVARLHPHACIECGLCSYVCPSELPLSEAATHLKQLAPPVSIGATRTALHR